MLSECIKVCTRSIALRFSQIIFAEHLAYFRSS